MLFCPLAGPWCCHKLRPKMFYSICPWRVCAHALQAAPKEIATVRWQIRQTHLQLKRIVKIRLWWWSSYQHARLILWRSKLQSCWYLQFFCTNVVVKIKINQKEALVGPFKYNCQDHKSLTVHCGCTFRPASDPCQRAATRIRIAL